MSTIKEVCMGFVETAPSDTEGIMFFTFRGRTSAGYVGNNTSHSDLMIESAKGSLISMWIKSEYFTPQEGNVLPRIHRALLEEW
jgi:hypothetical protein